ncbi:MarR family transcriptional regulator [Paenibacillus sp. LMG 31456]|uniref:MarR family transcriptional regulator n=1 Tax=Paenibacillus foliorum TaxID=2654974 RepID=A0A972K4P9_9BACL|nr:MarR family transcriptional regulator [Paenibacillus foliorum]NOU97178.1 MarR family transcriptional regulator [Paenibacillus foliorum]
MDESYLHNCLFFTTNRLSRAITKMAEEEFASTGLTPMYGYIIRLVTATPGISQKELSEKLYIAASTITRFIDKLEGKQLVERKVQGKTVLIYPTPKGKELEEAIRNASKSLHRRYEAILGTEASKQLSIDIEMTSEQLEKK